MHHRQQGVGECASSTASASTVMDMMGLAKMGV
jgi:hypothetical protein